MARDVDQCRKATGDFRQGQARNQRGGRGCQAMRQMSVAHHAGMHDGGVVSGVQQEGLFRGLPFQDRGPDVCIPVQAVGE